MKKVDPGQGISPRMPKHQKTQYETRQEVVRLYTEGEMNSPQVADALDLAESTVRLILKQEGVQMRSNGESIRLRYKHIWTPEKLEILRKEWEAGTPVSEICRKVGRRRYQVIGKAHRMRFAKRPNPVKKNSKEAEKTDRSKRKVRRLGEVKREIFPEPVAKARKCQWIYGEAKDQNFCLKPSVQGYSYCKEHKERVYIRG